MTAKIFIDGEAGTTGLQIRDRIISRADLTLIQLDDSMRKDPAARKNALNTADIAILCLPDAAAKEAVAMIENATTRVIDASTAYRVAANWTYGFAEMAPEHAENIAKARFVSNPGCYPQGFIAAVRPLVTAGIMPPDSALTYNAISGYSGGGKAMIAAYESGDIASPYMPYGLALQHKHLPEMTKYTGLSHAPVFQPAVGAYAQGMVGAVPLQLWSLPGNPSPDDIHKCLSAAYADHTFVTVAPLETMERSADIAPETLNGTNSLRLHVCANAQTGQAIIISIYDNLGKGASGAAIQNLNLMLGAPEMSGLTQG